MEVRAKKALGQHFLTDESIAKAIVDSLDISTIKLNSQGYINLLEVGPGMGVLSKYLIDDANLNFKMVEVDTESVDYLTRTYKKMRGRVLEQDFLKMDFQQVFDEDFCIIGNFPYNISSQIFFKVLDYKNSIPQVVCMIQKEVAQRIAEKPGTKTYGILSVLLQAWYDIEYLFTVGSGCFAPPPKVQSAVIRLRRNNRTHLGVDEVLFKNVVKTAFNQRRKTMRNSLKMLINKKIEQSGWAADSNDYKQFISKEIFDLRPEKLSVEQFIDLAKLFE